jgi:hypothetical protein
VQLLLWISRKWLGGASDPTTRCCRPDQDLSHSWADPVMFNSKRIVVDGFLMSGHFSLLFLRSESFSTDPDASELLICIHTGHQ